MSMFHKQRDDAIRHPRMCERCGERRGVVTISSIAWAAAGRLGGLGRDWWLCARCVAILRPGNPSES